MAEARAEEHRLAKLALLVALAIAGQLVARWIAGRYVANLSAPAQSASVVVDLILLGCVPFGYFLAPRVSIRVLPVLDEGNFNRAIFRALVLALISIAAALAVSMIPHTRASTSGVSAPIPFPVGIALAIAAAFREEIEFRLGLLTVLAAIVLTMTRDRSLSSWIANIAQAIAFGAIHQIAGFTGRTASLSLIGVLLEPRTISGVILGYAFIRFGLETAIMAHAIGDASILALAALLARG